MPEVSDQVYFASLAQVLLAEQEAETERRGLVFHTDFDPDLVFLRRPSGSQERNDLGAVNVQDAGEHALRALIRFVMATLPDGCEVYFSAARPAAPVVAVGAGVLTLRWQVAGDRRGGAEKGVVALRPTLGDAQAQVTGPSAQALRADFRAAGWPLTIEAIQGGGEIWVQAEMS